MNFCHVSWEDEEKNREVLLRVEYTTGGSDVAVSAITPEQVTFFCSETGDKLRSIRLWTQKAKEMLVRQFHASGKFDELLRDLGERDTVASMA